MCRSPASELCRSQSTLWTPAASAPPWMRAFSQLKWLALMLLHPRESRSVPTTTRRRRRPRPPLPRRRTQRRRKRQNRNQRSFHPLVLKNTLPWANRRPPRRRKRPTRRLPTPCQRRKRRMTRWRKQIAPRDPLAHIKVFFERFFYCLHWCLVSHTRYISILSFLLLSVKTTFFIVQRNYFLFFCECLVVCSISLQLFFSLFSSPPSFFVADHEFHSFWPNRRVEVLDKDVQRVELVGYGENTTTRISRRTIRNTL